MLLGTKIITVGGEKYKYRFDKWEQDPVWGYSYKLIIKK